LNLNSTLGEFLLCVQAEFLTQFRQNHISRMYQHDPQHVFSQIRVETHCLPHEIIDAGNGLHTGEASACHH